MLQQSTFIDWDFAEIWDIDENTSYPFLRNNENSMPHGPPERENDLGALYVSGPEINFVDSLQVHSVYVFNMGSNPQSYFQVRLLNESDIELGSTLVTETLHRFESIEVDVSWIPGFIQYVNLRGEVILQDDEYAVNNVSTRYPVWVYNGFSGGDGTSTNPFIITQGEQLYLINFFMDAHFEQDSDIDLDLFFEEGGWRPLGYYRSAENNLPFTGQYNGNNHTISNLLLTIDEVHNDYLGLFAYTGEESIIENIVLDNITIRSVWLHTGILSGLNRGLIDNVMVSNISFEGSCLSLGGLVNRNEGIVKNSRVEIPLSIPTQSGNIGGLVSLNNGQILNSSSLVEIDGGSIIGGLVFRNEDLGIINNCYTEGSVSGFNSGGGLVGQNFGSISNSYTLDLSVNGGENVGGLAGSNNGHIEYSFSSGNLIGDTRVGGLVGRNLGSINDSYSLSTVRGYMFVGGLAGWTSAASNIINTYAAGRVFGVFNRGGLIGQNNGSVTSSYWDIQATNQTSSSGGEGRTTAEMMQQVTFVGWDFDEIWDIIENETYPFLRFQENLDVEDEEYLQPQMTQLLGNYPNPFNPETTIRFHLANTEGVRIEIYNIRGQRIKILLDTHLERGEHKVVWNGKDHRGSYVSSGIYFYRLITSKGVEQRKMMLLK